MGRFAASMGPSGPVRTGNAVPRTPSAARPPYIRHTYPVNSTFNVVIWVVCVLAVLIAFGALIFSRKTWEDYGKGTIVMDREASGTTASSGERDTEIRQMLEARNERRARRGEPPIDVEDELARLTASAPAIDPALREEIRQLVVARNHRRVRAGKPPLDVEAEIEREIAGLSGLL
jgi:hypothetical protein